MEPELPATISFDIPQEILDREKKKQRRKQKESFSESRTKTTVKFVFRSAKS
jgi:hypothetical protein